MNAGWVALLLLVVGATGLALWAGPNLPIASVGAAIAVLAAGLLFVGAWLDRPNRRPTPAARGRDADAFQFRFGFRSGRFGREEIVATLDRIERWGPTPELPGRSTREMDDLVRLSGPEFSDYVRQRVEELEART
jgi:hypothetical protein